MSAADRWDSIDVPEAAPAPSAVDRWDASVPEGEKARPDKSALRGDVENFFAGMGQGAVSLGRGAKQIIDAPAQWLESKFPGISKWSQTSLGMPSAAQSAAQTNTDVSEAKTLDEPLLETKAGLAGSIGGNIAPTMLGAGGLAAAGSGVGRVLLNPTTYKAAAAAGALQGALQPVTEDESRMANTAIGTVAGMGGNAAVKVVGRIAQPVAQIASAAHDKAVSVLEAAGVPLDAAQRTGSAFLNKLRSSFSDNPFTAGAQADLISSQKGAFNKAVLGTIGEDSAAATPEVMGRAADRINGVFKDVLERNNVAVNDSTLARLGSVQQRALEEEKKPVSALANRFMDAVGDDGTVPGQIAYGVKKDLDRLASSSDSTLAFHAKQLRSTIMDAINGSLNDADRAAFAEARGQFANMKKIEGTIDREGSGDISPAKLANVFAQKQNRNTSIYGRGPQELFDLAQAGNMLLPDKTPNSGSVARGIMQATLPLVIGGAEGYRASQGEGGALEHGLGTMAAAFAAPRAAQAIMNNPATARYLSQGIRGSMTPLRDLLEAPQTNSIIGGAARRIAAPYELKKQASEGR